MGTRVVSYELNVSDASVEKKLFRQLGFEIGAEHELFGTAFDELLGLRGARAEQLFASLDQESLELRQFATPAPHTAQPQHANDLGFEHLAIVVRDIDAADAVLARTSATRVSARPQTLPASNPVAAGVRAEYFRDPEGHFLELIQFPPDKGKEAWHVATKRLFLGIDHSAIAVREATRSLRFYRDTLGLHVQSESLNEGPEQEALSGVAGARVHIVSLAGSKGPGIELLEYLAPTDGLPFPEITPADTAHWEIVIQVSSIGERLAELRNAGFLTPEQSTQSTTASTIFPGEKRAALVTDPDGHTVRLFEAVERGSGT